MKKSIGVLSSLLLVTSLGVLLSACHKNKETDNMATGSAPTVEESSTNTEMEDDTNSDIDPDVKSGSESDFMEIVNGRRVSNTKELGKFVVALVSTKKSSQALCTGTLLTEDIVLTAAHCVENSPETLTIIFGSEVKAASQANMRNAIAYAQNPLWHHASKKGHGDLALVRFSGKPPAGYKPVLLVNKNVNLAPASEVMVVGFGVSDGSSHFGAGFLRQAQTSIIGKYTPTEIVTDGKKSSVCFGDSGGPAFIKDGNHYVQWGVASSVTNKACNEAAIHTSILGYKSWIKTTITKLRRHQGPL